MCSKQSFLIDDTPPPSYNAYKSFFLFLFHVDNEGKLKSVNFGVELRDR